MAQTTGDIVIEAAPSDVMDVIADFDAYPTWATGVTNIDVLEIGNAGRARRVRFTLDASPIKDTYILVYEWNSDFEVTWSIDEAGSMLKTMDGAYILTPEDNGSTQVTYQLSVELSIPILGLLRRKAEKVIIDTALKGLKTRVEQQ